MNKEHALDIKLPDYIGTIISGSDAKELIQSLSAIDIAAVAGKNEDLCALIGLSEDYPLYCTQVWKGVVDDCNTLSNSNWYNKATSNLVYGEYADVNGSRWPSQCVPFNMLPTYQEFCYSIGISQDAMNFEYSYTGDTTSEYVNTHKFTQTIYERVLQDDGQYLVNAFVDPNDRVIGILFIDQRDDITVITPRS